MSVVRRAFTGTALVVGVCLVAWWVWLSPLAGGPPGPIGQGTGRSERAVAPPIDAPVLPVSDPAGQAPEPLSTEGGLPMARAVVEGASPGDPLVVSGRVVDADGEPIEGARIRHLPRGHALVALGLGAPIDDCPRYMAVNPQRFDGVDLEGLPDGRSDAAGRFTLAARTVLDVKPYGEHENLGRSTDTLIVEAAGLTAVLAELKLLEAEMDVGDIRLEPETRVSGRVVDESGRPVAGAGVSITIGRITPARLEKGQHPATWHTRVPGLNARHTGEDGRFTLDKLWGGPSRLVCRAAGRVAVTAERELPPGGTVDVGDVVLVRGHAVSGHVLDRAGAPIAGASVWLTGRTIDGAFAYDRGIRYGEGDDTILDAVRQVRQSDGLDAGLTDAAGRFTISGLDAPNLTLYAVADGYEPKLLEGVAAGASSVQVVLDREALLVVDLVAGDGTPLEGGSLQVVRLARAERAELSWPRAVLQAEEARASLPSFEARGGRFLVRQVGPVANALTASAPGHATTTRAHPGVAAGEVEQLELRLERESRLEGQIVDGGGSPVAQAQVRLVARPEVKRQVLATTLSDADGRFEFQQLGQGPLAYYVRADGWGETPTRTVDLGAGERRTDERVVLQPAARIEGRWLTAGGEPVTKGRIRVDVPPYSGFKYWELSEEFPTLVEPDAEGRFVVEGLAAGTYQLSSRGGWVLEVALQPGESREVELRPPSAITVSGRVLSAGAPVRGIVVKPRLARSVTGGAPLWNEGVTTADDGSYALELSVPGTWRLWTEGQGFPDGDGPDGHSVELELSAGETRVVDFDLPTGELRGIIRDAETGEPLAAAVSVCLDGNRRVSWRHAEADGRFVFRCLVPGSYRLHCGGWLQGGKGTAYVPRWFPEATLEEGEILDGLVLELTAGGSLSGRVLTRDGLVAQDGLRVSIVCLELAGAGYTPGLMIRSGGGDPSTYLVEHDLADVWQETRSKDGRYTFEHLPPGVWRVACAAESAAEVRDLGESLTLRTGEETTVDVRALR